MKIITKDIPKEAQTQYTIIVEGKEWNNCLKKGLEEITKNIEVPGFRKGKVPLEVVKSKVSDEKIIEKAAPFASDLAYKHLLKVKKPNLIMQPVLDIGKIDDQQVELHFIVQNLPKIELDKYTKLGVKFIPPQVSDKEINIEINKILDKAFPPKISNNQAKEGSIVEINFEGFINGKAFKGGKAERYNLELGSNRFIPGFEKQLIGLKAGENKEITVVFPEKYHVKKMIGKKATFKCHVIAVKEKQKPKLSDDLIKEKKFFNASNVQDFRKKVESLIMKYKTQQAEIKQQEAIVEKLLQKAKFVVPKKFLELETNTLIKDFEKRLKKQGLTLDKFKKITKQSDADIAKNYARQAEKRVRVSLIFEHIAQQEKIDIKPQELEQRIQKIAQSQNQKVEDVKKQISMGRLAYEMRMNKIFNIIKN